MHKNTQETGAAPEDAIELLKADHRRVKHLFARFDALKEGGDDDDKARVVELICDELTIHTALEEEIFYPATREAIEDDDQMDEALVEHAGAKALITQLRSAHPDDDLYDARVTVLSEQIDHHVTEEEGSLFPKASHAGLDLEALAAQMLLRKKHLLESPRELRAQDAGREAAEALERADRSERTPKSTPRPPSKKKPASKSKTAKKKPAKRRRT